MEHLKSQELKRGINLAVKFKSEGRPTFSQNVGCPAAPESRRAKISLTLSAAADMASLDWQAHG
jgi:hypothetical protein